MKKNKKKIVAKKPKFALGTGVPEPEVQPQAQPATNNNIFTGTNSNSVGGAAFAAASMIDRSNPNNQYQSASEKQVDDIGTGVASAIGPWWGALSEAGQFTSKTAKGDGTKTANVAVGNLDDPFNMFKDPGEEFGKDKTLRTIGNVLTGGVGRILNSGNQAKRTREERDRPRKEAEAAARMQWLTTSGNNQTTLPTFAKGGQLNSISPDAVEVKANDPSKTDSVELPQAFVDNNEVIDNKDRVFSDDLKLPSGRSIANEAKRLEKMKSTSSRFTAANTHLDGKLDDLFRTQETIKSSSTMVDTSKAKTRTSVDSPTSDTFSRMMLDHNLGKGSRAKGGKLSLAGGGPFSEADLYPSQAGTQVTGLGQITDPNTTWDTSTMGLNSKSAKEPSWLSQNIGTIGQGIANYGPDIANLVLTAKMPKPPSAMTESSRQLERFRPGAQLAENARQSRNAMQRVKATTSQAGVAASNIGSILAKKFYADNQVNDNINQLNANVNNQEAQLNTSIQARNVDRKNQFNLLKTEQKNRQLSAYSQIASNIGQKAALQRRENNEKDLSLAQLEIMKQQYKDSGIYDRNFEKIMEDYKKKQNLRKGGKMKRGSC